MVAIVEYRDGHTEAMRSEYLQVILKTSIKADIRTWTWHNANK